MKEIVSVGYCLPTHDDDFIKLDSNSSLSDADLVIFCPDFKTTNFSYGLNSTYKGKISYDLNTSSRIIEATKHWRKELNSYLKSGRNLFIFLCQKNEFYIDTGQRNTSGTGRNQKVTNIVDSFNNYKVFPFDIDVNNAKGKKIISKNELLKSFYNSFEKNLSFEAYLEPKDHYTELLQTKTLDKTLSVTFKKDEGQIIILPYLDTSKDEFYDKHGEWTQEGIIFGKKLIQCILEIDKKISSQHERTAKPEWLENEEYNLEKAEEISELIKKKKKSIQKLEDECEELNQAFIEEETFKDLLFETGKPLEVAVIKALEILGYKAENFNNGALELDQVITSPENFRYIGECEGKDSKAIDITKFRQLQDSLNEDFEREEIYEKAFGLLFGNPQRLNPLGTRKDFFTEKCIKGAEREKIGLIKTIDLFFVCKYLSVNNDDKFKKKCRNAIHSSLGSIVKFPDIPKK
ncbi:hypothetical protein NAT51_15480 [Flavobacterium amniphilum]|uniref:hypothetical protein n=1 Tax=Flavobacterium amniphilum TaxID=1834035 RepID=UPI00202A1638|nr:hypothetical protein [Flavobacterium amniphilum]MCL9806937.1 hypothetical protein [Flavobacterium amniphilum]